MKESADEEHENDGNQDDGEKRPDRGAEGAVASSDLSAMSPWEFTREARRRKGLDPERLSDLPDEADGMDESTESNERTERTGDYSGSGTAAGGGESNGDRSGCGRVRVPWAMPRKWLAGSVRVGPMEPGITAVVEALADLEAPAEIDDGCLHERTVDLLRARSLLDAAITTHVRQWDNRALWGSDGSKSPTARLARDANCSRAAAGGAVKLARALARMPQTSAALADGRISLDHARRLVQACTDERLALFVEAEDHLISEAATLAGNHKGFCQMVRHWELITDDKLHDPTDPDDEPPGQKRQRLGRDFRIIPTPDGCDLTGTLPTGDGTIFATQFQHIYDELWEADWAAARVEHGDDACTALLWRTVAQRRADALVEMARRASAHHPGTAVARPLVTVLVNAPDLTGPIRETFNGTVLSRRDVADWLTEADFERITFDPTGKPVDITSPARFFTGPMRRAVQIRDRFCSHPTCDIDAERCQVDHIIEHTDGGPTNIDNARLLCPTHNQQRPGRAKKPPPGGQDDSDSDCDSDGEGDCDCDGDGNVDGDDGDRL